MIRIQQHVYICAPAPLQFGVAEAFGVDIAPTIERFGRRRDLVLERLGPLTDIPRPAGAFYAFVKVPEHLRMTGTDFTRAAMARRVVVVPGAAFSARDTHIRLSYAVDDERLRAGLDILASMLRR
jgi:aspartate aminotransferase/aminotransferase